MKHIILLGDGMAGWPIKELGAKTCMQAATTPNMDRLASASVVGVARTVPDGYPAGSDVANLSIFGYDPARYYTGRAPLEAASMGVSLESSDVAYRCNLVTLTSGNGNTVMKDYGEAVMDDYSGGHITTEEAHALIRSIQKKLATDKINFYPGVSYRHLMVWNGGSDKLNCTPPHDITGRKITEYLPTNLPDGEGQKTIRSLMQASVEILQNDPVNLKRKSAGKKIANSIWLWGQGRRPAMPTFKAKYGKTGAIISAVDLTKGIAVLAGFEVINVEGATGYIDTNYEGKVEASLKALERLDMVYLHVEAPDEAGHTGNIKDKITAIEDFDSRIVGPVLKGLEKFGNYRVLVMPDHPTPIEIRTHSPEPVPFLIYTKDDKPRKKRCFNENIKNDPDAITFDQGHKLMDYFLDKSIEKQERG